MVLHLSADKPWSYKLPDDKARAEVDFASASAAAGDPTLWVRFNDEEFDCVTLRVPHSWWPMSKQPFCPPIAAGDELVVATSGPVDIRIDLVEHEA